MVVMLTDVSYRVCEEVCNPVKQLKKAKCTALFEESVQVESISTLLLAKKSLSGRINEREDTALYSEQHFFKVRVVPSTEPWQTPKKPVAAGNQTKGMKFR